MATKTKTQPVTTLAPPNPDLEEVAFTRTAGEAIATFVSQLPAFFRRARVLEDEAAVSLAGAKQLTAPTTAEEDAALQSRIKIDNTAAKTIMEHWEISTMIYNLQRRVAARRNRGVEMRKESADIAQKLHNRYVDEARRKAEAEQNRLRLVAEEKARQDRQAELAEIERQALEAEASSADLSEREQAFVQAYFAGQGTEGNATAAATRAGFKNAAQTGARLLGTAKVQTALQGLVQAAAMRLQAAAVKEAPLDVQVATVTPDIQKASGAVDRTTKSAEIVDADAFMTALFEGKHGIPRDTVAPSQTVLNGYARSMGELVNRWPGIRLKKETRTV